MAFIVLMGAMVTLAIIIMAWMEFEDKKHIEHAGQQTLTLVANDYSYWMIWHIDITKKAHEHRLVCLFFV